MTRTGGLSVIAFCVVQTACAAAVSPGARGGAPAAETRVFDSRAGRYVDMQDAVNAAARADVVFFGEQHDDPATHRAELAYLAAIGAQRRNVVVSLEMFERDVQAALNRYTAGQVAESVFVATSRPWPNYASDYRAIVELSRAHGWPVVASNIPRRLASAVSRAGMSVLDTIPPTDRAYAARDMSCPRDTYYQRFAAEMSGHSAGGVSTAADSAASLAVTYRFYEAQCAKDETMAESIVAALERGGRDAIVVHFNGAFHSNMSLGTVSRVQRRLPRARLLVITAVPVDDVKTANAASFGALGDYIVLTPKPLKPRP